MVNISIQYTGNPHCNATREIAGDAGADLKKID
ncbi:MAG: hypothetical protein QOJ45_1969 [Verrucomicrobiota bacterium]|jgi:hypothetical protein